MTLVLQSFSIVTPGLFTGVSCLLHRKGCLDERCVD